MFSRYAHHRPLNTATENALNSMLAVGNNQMGGNTNTNQINANN